MNKLISFLALSLFAATTYAAEPAKHFWAPTLDVAKVISQTTDDGSCGLEPMKMTYEDSKGVRHTVNYVIQGNGCSNG